MEENRMVSQKFKCLSCNSIFKKLVKLNEEKTSCKIILSEKVSYVLVKTH